MFVTPRQPGVGARPFRQQHHQSRPTNNNQKFRGPQAIALILCPLSKEKREDWNDRTSTSLIGIGNSAAALVHTTTMSADSRKDSSLKFSNVIHVPFVGRQGARIIKTFLVTSHDRSIMSTIFDSYLGTLQPPTTSVQKPGASLDRMNPFSDAFSTRTVASFPPWSESKASSFNLKIQTRSPLQLGAWENGPRYVPQIRRVAELAEGRHNSPRGGFLSRIRGRVFFEDSHVVRRQTFDDTRSGSRSVKHLDPVFRSGGSGAIQDMWGTPCRRRTLRSKRICTIARAKRVKS